MFRTSSTVTTTELSLKKKINRRTILICGLYAATAIIIFFARTSLFYAIKGWI